MEGEIPFTQAATIGTKKVIYEHATIGIVITTDGSIGQIERENYRDAERRTIQELQVLQKPFIVIVNSQKPFGEEAKSMADSIAMEYGVVAIPINCAQLREEDIHVILLQMLNEFPVTEVQFRIPKWVEMLSVEHKMKQEILEYARKILDQIQGMRSVKELDYQVDCSYIHSIELKQIHMDTGVVQIEMHMKEACYYEVLSQLTGTELESEYDLIKELKELAMLKREYQEVQDALTSVKKKVYGEQIFLVNLWKS